MSARKSQQRFPNSLNERFWNYVAKSVPDPEQVLDKIPASMSSRPPVFGAHARALNLLAPTTDTDRYRAQLMEQMPKSDVHRHFGSMKSSQALALSVFGGLKLQNRLDVLAGIEGEDGFAIFGTDLEPESIQFEHEVTTLGEPRPTSVDVLINGKKSVMIECKFTEDGVGSCSRPRLKPKDNNFERDYCDGSYRQQNDREARCSLTQNGIRYWDHLSELFGWDNAGDQIPCPMRYPYQLVRNVLAAVVDEDGALDIDRGHAVLVYDDRNPTFQPDGAGMMNWMFVKNELNDPNLLQRCSWQEIARRLRACDDLSWLSEGLAEKYGF
jgi:Restriction Endonuclease associating with ARP